MVGSSMTHLQLSNRASNGEIARSMAESMVAVGLEEVLQNENFGQLRSEAEVLALKGAEPGARGRLTFNVETAKDWGVPHSTNNLENDGAVAGFNGRVVPASSLHLVGTGECNGVTRTVEAILYVPRFPYVIASAGKFATEGETLVASVDGSEPVVDWRNLDHDRLKPGDVVANSPASDALKLGPGTTITGDAKTVGGVQIENGAQVLGQLRTNAGAEKIPRYAVEDYDPSLTGKLGVNHIGQSVVNRGAYEGWNRREGDLFVSNGLHLDNGVLFVNGNLSVTGGVTGMGALLVTGDTYVSGRSTLHTDNLAAIISEGDVVLEGVSAANSMFRGLIYSNGGLRAQNITLLGTLLVSGTSGDLKLTDTLVIQSPDTVVVDLKHQARTGLNFVSPKGSNPGAFLGTKSTHSTLSHKQTIYVSFFEGEFLIYPAGKTEIEALRASSAEEAFEIIRDLVAVQGAEDLGRAFDSTTLPRLPILLSGLADGSVAPEEPALDLLTLDPTHFLSLSDKLRLVLMRELE